MPEGKKNFWLNVGVTIGLSVLCVLLKGIMCYFQLLLFTVLITRHLTNDDGQSQSNRQSVNGEKKQLKWINLAPVIISLVLFTLTSTIPKFDLSSLPIEGIGIPFSWEDDVASRPTQGSWENALVSGSIGLLIGMIINVFYRESISLMLADRIRWAFANPKIFAAIKKYKWRNWILLIILLISIDWLTGGLSYIIEWQPNPSRPYKDYFFAVVGQSGVPILLWSLPTLYLVYSKEKHQINK